MRRRAGLLLLFVCAGALVAYKQATRPRIVAAAAASVRGPRAAPTVLLFADPREAGTRCVCGQIFEVARAARKRGANVREIDPEHDDATPRAYRVTMEPTLLVLDGAGREVARHEGESADVLAAIRRDLETLPSR